MITDDFQVARYARLEVPGGDFCRAGIRTRQSRKSASNMAPRMRATALCTSRSSTVGIPNGLVLPSPFGISTRRTGGALYGCLEPFPDVQDRSVQVALELLGSLSIDSTCPLAVH